ncbi:MAG TPA: hypothetical protein VMM38_09615 [Aridibacter sp.]|nr:hypothetical protein [Aridibacter sp.]
MTVSQTEDELYLYGEKSFWEFKGRFSSSGFSLFTECKTNGGPACIPGMYSEGVRFQNAFNRIVSGEMQRTSIRYKYDVKPIAKDLILVTEFSHEYVFSGVDLDNQGNPKQDWEGRNLYSKVAINENSLRRQFYLVRGNSCAASAVQVRESIVEGEFSDRLVFFLGPPKPLPAGSVIYEYGIVEKKKMNVTKPACFFFIDPTPTARFAHPVLYLISDPVSGKIIGREWASSPPIVKQAGSVSFDYVTLEGRLESPDLLFPTRREHIQRPVIPTRLELVLSSEERIEARRGFELSPVPNGPKAWRSMAAWIEGSDSPLVLETTRDRGIKAELREQDCNRYKGVALLVNAGTEAAMDEDIRRMSELFGKLRYKIVTKSWKTDSLDQVRKAIAQESADMDGCSVFVLYVTGHVEANTRGLIRYMHPFEVGTERVDHGQLWHPSNLKVNAGNAHGADTGPGVFFTLRSINAGHISVILDYCMAEYAIDAAISPIPGIEGQPISGFLAKNQSLSIYAASSRAQLSGIFVNSGFFKVFTDPFTNDDDRLEVGGVYTQKLADAAPDDVMHSADIDSNGFVGPYEFEQFLTKLHKTASANVSRVSREVSVIPTQDPVSRVIRGIRE